MIFKSDNQHGSEDLLLVSAFVWGAFGSNVASVQQLFAGLQNSPHTTPASFLSCAWTGVLGTLSKPGEMVLELGGCKILS